MKSHRSSQNATWVNTYYNRDT